MDENQQVEAQATANAELETLIALVEARVVENLTRIIERLARENGERGA